MCFETYFTYFSLFFGGGAAGEVCTWHEKFSSIKMDRSATSIFK